MSNATFEIRVERARGSAFVPATDVLAVEEPLEIQLVFGPVGDRRVKTIAVTMRTPSFDLDLAIGFLLTEGIIHDRVDVDHVGYLAEGTFGNDEGAEDPFRILRHQTSKNVVQIELAPHVPVALSHISRNFYTTSSCGVCGKASLMALQAVCPARAPNRLLISVESLYALPVRLRQAQDIFQRTGGLHGAAFFDTEGAMISMREDVGRHNAVDKLIGDQFLQDRIPLRNTVLMLSGRASFELLQKALMGGVSMVAAVGAPSSLAVHVARQFDIALVGFLRDNHFNVYYGLDHVSGLVDDARGEARETTN